MEPNESQKGEFSSLITGLKQKRPVSQAEIAEEKARLGSAGPVGQPTSLSHPHLLAPGESWCFQRGNSDGLKFDQGGQLLPEFIALST